MQSTTSSIRTFMKPPTPAPQPKKPKRDIKLGGLAVKLRSAKLTWIVMLLLLIFSAFMFFQYQEAQTKLHPAATNTRKVTSLVEKVGKIMVLPKNETPTIATVLHADKLRSQTFFANAKDGDRVLVYNSEHKAILYRPSTNQIVNVAPVTVNSSGTNIQSQ